MRWALVIVGGLMVLMGGTWLLQGVGILPGSFMTGQTFWAMVGAAVLIVGLALCYLGAPELAARIGCTTVHPGRSFLIWDESEQSPCCAVRLGR